jgi:hypothetical protein
MTNIVESQATFPMTPAATDDSALAMFALANALRNTAHRLVRASAT